MISWMQKHNKYLVWTIWVATITFIGAGFVGWGSYKLGTKAQAIAQVGNIDIKQNRFNMVYTDMYNRYRDMFRGNFDDAKAQKLQLPQQAFSMLAKQALLLNYARDIGIVVDDAEIARLLESLPVFQQNGSFDKTLYKTYLKNRGLSPKVFESALRDDIMINKLTYLLHLPLVDFETESIYAAFSVSDTIRYRILSNGDITVSVDDDKLKNYWQQHKSDYKTPTRYVLSVLWIKTDDIAVSDEELQSYYQTNSFNYVDSEGKLLDFDKAKNLVARDLRVKKGKKKAQLAYINLKKHKSTETRIKHITVDKNDPIFTTKTWNDIIQADKGSLLKPKIIGSQYAVIRIDDILPPKTMNFEEAKPFVQKDFIRQLKRQELDTLSKKSLQEIMNDASASTATLQLDAKKPIKGLDLQEMTYFLQKLFTSDKEKGIISLTDKRIVYAVLKQKLLPADSNKTRRLHQTAETLKNDVYDAHLLETLEKRYPIKVFVKGLTP